MGWHRCSDCVEMHACASMLLSCVAASQEHVLLLYVAGRTTYVVYIHSCSLLQRQHVGKATQEMVYKYIVGVSRKLDQMKF